VDKAWLKLPLLTLLAGIILRISDRISVAALMRGTNHFTFEMGTTVSSVRTVISIAAFVAIGLYLRKRYDKRFIAKSATILVVYSIAMLVWEQAAQYYGTYIMLIYWMYLPAEMFTGITSVMLRLIDLENTRWIYAIPSLFAPYLFVLFGKRPVR
jgi:hypothetical protein